MADKITGPASYFPSIETKYGGATIDLLSAYLAPDERRMSAVDGVGEEA